MPSYRTDAAGSIQSSSPVLAIALVIVGLPVIVLLVLIGLLYEVVIRVAGRRLPGWLDWLLASAAGVAIVVGLGWWVFSRI